LIGNLALIQQLSQEEIRQQILHTWESARHSWVVPLHLGPIDISINKAVWFLWIGTLITFLILFVASRMLKNRPGAYQVIVEETYGFGRNNLGGQVSEEGRKWFPYTLSLFVFLLVLNILGLFPGSYPVTSNISFTLALALLTFLLTQYEGFRRNGAGPYLKSFVPPDLPWKPIMVPFALRLYANILAGHLIIFVFLSFILYFGTFMAIISVPAAVVFFGFEIFVAVLQAYIFAILTQVYIELAMFRDH
jgi:F-type H+-transporting ATPase subunit a